MEVVIALPLLVVPFIIPFITGCLATTYGRSFWLWFWLGLPLPFIACAILLCMADKSDKPKKGKPNYFEQLYFDDEYQKNIVYGSRFSTSAQRSAPSE